MQEGKVSSTSEFAEVSEQTLKHSRQLGVRKPIIGILAILLVAGLICAGILTKRIAVAVMPNTKAMILTEVCHADDIAEFNKYSQGASVSLEPLAKEVAARSNYKNDPTCVYIEYIYLRATYKYSDAVTRGEQLLKMMAQGYYTSNALYSTESISSKSIESDLQLMRTLRDGKPMIGGTDDDY